MNQKKKNNKKTGHKNTEKKITELFPVNLFGMRAQHFQSKTDTLNIVTHVFMSFQHTQSHQIQLSATKYPDKTGLSPDKVWFPL